MPRAREIQKLSTSVSWVEAYASLRIALKKYMGKHRLKTGSRLFERLFGSKLFKEQNLWIRNLAAYKMRWVDPIHVFASISNNRFDAQKRINLINLYLKLLNAGESYSEIDFKGCPAPIITSIVGPRNEDHSNEIWDVFDKVITRHKEALSEELFRRIKTWYGIEIPSFTIFLFWIDSSNFISLDKNSVSLLRSYGKISTPVRRYHEYSQLIEYENATVYRSIAKVSIDPQELDRLNTQEKHQFEKYFAIRITELTKSQAETRGDFKIIALRPLSRCQRTLRKILKPNKIYYFYSDYRITNNSTILYESNKSATIYNLDNIKLNISAIVGKNGSGKSTIIDLLLVTLNNFTCRFLNKSNKKALKYESGLFVELYFKTSDLFKIVIKGNAINIYKYENISDGIFSNPVNAKNFRLDEFFYTVFINWSQYGFNSNHLGLWIDSIFRKNDGYQIPISLDPFRNKGNIDINKQEELLSSRLLGNLLQPEQEGDENSFRKLTPTLKATKIRFSLNDEKTLHLFARDEGLDVEFVELHDARFCLETFFERFEVKGVSPLLDNSNNVVSHAKKYILRKLVNIARKYFHYRKYFNESIVAFVNLEEYIGRLRDDPSHVTYKLRQAVNFLRFHIVAVNKTYLIDELALHIQKIIADSGGKISTIELTPPVFLKYELELSNSIKFDSLSSGEKQKIYSVQSLLYHVRNIDSVFSTLNTIKYPYINIILDEIELYFHPELQRTFITYLIDSLRKAYLTTISGINICFVTHSPFILSDIPVINTLSLDEGNQRVKVDVKTFGANIHELLVDGFFMDHTLGQFALNKVTDIRIFYEKVVRCDEENLDQLKHEYKAKKSEFKFVLENLGEEYLHKILENHIELIEEKLGDSDYLDKQIDVLEEKISKLKTRKSVQN